MKTIKIDTLIEAPVDVCFDLARSVEVHLYSTAHTDEKAIAGRTSGLCEQGDTISWRAKHFGVYQRLTVRITAMEYPAYFQDQMVKGAFRSFTHDHHFSASGSGTLMQDIFTFAPLFGWLGSLAERLFLEKYMRRLLVQRNAAIKELAETDRWREVLGR